MAVIGEHLYVYGGTTGHVYNTELHRLDLNANVWHKVKPSNAFNELPNERYVITASRSLLRAVHGSYSCALSDAWRRVKSLNLLV